MTDATDGFEDGVDSDDLAGEDIDRELEGLDAVTRRRFLAWVGAAAVGVAAVTRGGDTAAALDRSASPVGAAARPGPHTTRRTRTLFFGLADYRDNRRPDLPKLVRFELSVLGTRYQIEELGTSNRDRLVAHNSMAQLADPAKLTHVVRAVELYEHWPVAMPLIGYDEDGTELILGYPIAIPRRGVRRAARLASRVGPLGDYYGDDSELGRLGISRPPLSVGEAVQWNDLYETTSQIAQSLVFKHPTIMNFDATSSAITQQLLANSGEVDGLADQVQNLINEFGMYGQDVPMTDGAGNQLDIVNPSDPSDTAPACGFKPFTQPTTITYADQQYPVTEEDIEPFVSAFNNAVTTLSNQVQGDVALEGDDGSWILTPGEPPSNNDVSDVDLGDGATFAIDEGWHSKTQVEITKVSGEEFGTAVTLSAENWNEKIFGIYAQYLDADGALLESETGHKFSDSDPSDFGGVLSGASVYMGIPVDGGSTTVQFSVPLDAVSTRILICGMGWGSKWRNYWPDHYQGMALPGPCLEWVIFTSAINLAVPAVMLVMDAIAFGNVYSSATETAEKYATAIQDSAEDGEAMVPLLKQEMEEVLENFSKSGATEKMARLLTGALSMADLVQTAGSFGAVMQMLSSLTEMFLQVLASQYLESVLITMLEDEASEDAAKAIPIVGEVFAALSVAGDVASLATAITEWLTEDWVIERTLQATYTATVSVGWDKDKDSSFPASARKWVLTPHLSKNRTLDGMEDPNFQSNGRWDPEDGDLDITVPNVLLGGMIQYTISFTDENGNQVGTGASGWLDNTNMSSPPSPSFDITELAVPITSQSTFDRAWTTEWDDTVSPAKYVQNPDLTVAGTVVDQACQSVDAVCAAGSMTVGTVTGRMGYVWESSNGWFVRQLSTSSNPGEYLQSIDTPYVAAPLMVYDVLNNAPTDGANYLLDPFTAGASGRTSPAYYVRQLDLTASGFGIDPTKTLGVFRGTIDAVTLHPAGYLIGVSTHLGKLQILHLPDTPGDVSDEASFPTANQYSGAGNPTGARPGLTQQPIDVAVALNGVILVLEAGANRIQSFDYKGNPVPYFPETGGAPNSQYYLQLDADKTYLGLDVDGTGAIYSHNYTGNGSDVSDYGVDVYKPTGEFVFRGAGINSSSVAVDYWRNIYAQNYVPVQKKSDGGAHLTSAGVAEPSVSTWVPDTPV